MYVHVHVGGWIERICYKNSMNATCTSNNSLRQSLKSERVVQYTILNTFRLMWLHICFDVLRNTKIPLLTPLHVITNFRHHSTDISLLQTQDCRQLVSRVSPAKATLWLTMSKLLQYNHR